ncbi:hypothetical protein BD779DRAFT_480153 [Infundibulicybe gibba]|nr:hypothetical protein BD779DRAFT_480153 [Infundibulicybe gibba]
MPGLLSLPNELISDIGDELDTRKVFRSTCKRINAVVSPRVFSYITIDIHGDRLDVGISQLEALATKSTCAAEYVHTIDIRRLAANTHRGHTFINGKLVVRKELESSKTDWAQEKMRELLPEALSTLKGATTAIWMIYSGNPDWTSVLVSEFLGTLPALNALHLSMLGKLKPLAHQLRISSLTKLIVKSDPDAAIAEIIANNPHLTYLDILMIRYGVAGDTATLHSLLEKVPLGGPCALNTSGSMGAMSGLTTEHCHTSAI